MILTGVPLKRYGVMNESLYFLAISPPQEIQDEITRLKHLMAEKFGSRHALKSPPHITLHMPFRWKQKKIKQLFEVLKKINASAVSFEIELKGFDFFEPRVVFVNVMENVLLSELQQQVAEYCRKDLRLDNANYKNQPFHPHITIGFRDLKTQMFYEASAYFEWQTFSRSFSVKEVDLLQYDGERWNILNLL